jgi:hypothetical protein
MEDAIAVFFIFGGGAAFLLAISPIGRAIGDRIRGKGLGGGADERVRYLQEGQDALLEEVEGLRHEVGDLQERVDFTERLLARNQGQGQLPDSPDVHN